MVVGDDHLLDQQIDIGAPERGIVAADTLGDHPPELFHRRGIDSHRSSRELRFEASPAGLQARQGFAKLRQPSGQYRIARPDLFRLDHFEKVAQATLRGAMLGGDALEIGTSPLVRRIGSLQHGTEEFRQSRRVEHAVEQGFQHDPIKRVLTDRSCSAPRGPGRCLRVADVIAILTGLAGSDRETGTTAGRSASRDPGQ